MKLHLNHTPTPLQEKIGHADKILMVGSCFAENIGDHLLQYKFNALVNPNGILFNPISISKAIQSFIGNSDVKDSGLVKNSELYYSFDHHGEFHSESQNELLVQIKASRSKAHSFLKDSNWLIITFGSAFVYRYLKTNSIVANCHKLPQQEFKKELLSVENITGEFNSLIKALVDFNPELKIILTVSPVKYLRDGLVENNLSKATLIQSVHELIRNNENCYYFPAYELVTDDLRDYRFYKEDLAHPNEAAIKYVWDKFSEAAFDNGTKKLNERIKEIIQASNHRPIHQNSAQHIDFKKDLLKKCDTIEKEFPFLNFDHERSVFN